MRTEKLYSPVFVKIVEDVNKEYYDGDYWNDPVSQRKAVAYEDVIHEALLRERHHTEEHRGLMTYYREDDSVNEKVFSMNIDVEVHDGRLWGVAALEVSEPLTTEEYDKLKDYLLGQYSDGFGEGFEQRGIQVDDDELFVSLWDSGYGFFIDTQHEFANRLGLEYLIPAQSEKPLAPMQAAVSEPDESEAADTVAMFKLLKRKIFLNLTDYFDSLQGRDPVELVNKSLEISAITGAYYYMTKIHGFQKSELEYLLRFQDPLKVVAYEFEWENAADNRSEVMWNMFQRQEALHNGKHAFVPGAEPPIPENRELRLRRRLDENFAEYKDDTLALMRDEELFMAAAEIASVSEAYDYFNKEHRFTESEVEFLLKFDNPLEVISDKWDVRLRNLPQTLEHIFGNQEQTLNSMAYSLTPPDGGFDDPVADKPTVVTLVVGQDEKPSVMEQIRQAAKEARERPAVTKDAPGQSKTEPDL